VDISNSKGKYTNAVNQFSKLKDMIRQSSGPEALAAIMDPTSKLLHHRSELVRDVVICEVQAVIEEEALRFINMTKEERESAARFLADNPVKYLNRLSKTICERAKVMPVGNKLGAIIDSL
jgi:hypothetical protein